MQTDRVSLFPRNHGLAAGNSSHFFGTELFHSFEMQSRSSRARRRPLRAGSCENSTCAKQQQQQHKEKALCFRIICQESATFVLSRMYSCPPLLSKPQPAVLLHPKLLRNRLAGGRFPPPPSSSSPPSPCPAHLLPPLDPFNIQRRLLISGGV